MQLRSFFFVVCFHRKIANIFKAIEQIPRDLWLIYWLLESYHDQAFYDSDRWTDFKKIKYSFRNIFLIHKRNKKII